MSCFTWAGFPIVGITLMPDNKSFVLNIKWETIHTDMLMFMCIYIIYLFINDDDDDADDDYILYVDHESFLIW